jgi:hypothetical protein
VRSALGVFRGETALHLRGRCTADPAGHAGSAAAPFLPVPAAAPPGAALSRDDWR